jgi:hypothetical protein
MYEWVLMTEVIRIVKMNGHLSSFAIPTDLGMGMVVSFMSMMTMKNDGRDTGITDSITTIRTLNHLFVKAHKLLHVPQVRVTSLLLWMTKSPMLEKSYLWYLPALYQETIQASLPLE